MKDKIRSAFLSMKRQDAVAAVKEALEAGIDPLDILATCREAMEEVGRRFEAGQFFLSELIYSAEVFKAVNAILEPRLAIARTGEDEGGVVVFGTPQGDIHDLGKNIVITLMRASGIEVHDLGVDVPPERFIDELRTKGAGVLAMSALITPAFVSMKETIQILERKGMRNQTFVLIGGGVTTEFARREMGADAQTLNPPEAIRWCKQFFREGPPARE